MDLGDIVSASWGLYVRCWRSLLSMAFLTGAGSLLAYVGLLPLLQRSEPAGSTGISAPLMPIGLAPLLVAGALLILFNQLALVRYCLEASIHGQAQGAACYRFAVRCYPASLVAAALTWIVVTVGAFTLIGIPVAVYLLVAWFFAFAGQVFMAEGPIGPFQAIRRSRAIVRGGWWRAAGVLLGISLLALLPSLAVSVLPANGLAGALLLSAIATALAAPFLAGAQTMLYLDLRLRKHESITLAPNNPPAPL